MKIYKIVCSCDTGSKEFDSNSRNAKKHLINEYGPQGGARCEVYLHDEKLSECRYSDEFGFYYVNI